MSELVERLREVQGLLDRRTMFESAETVALAIEALEAKEAAGQWQEALNARIAELAGIGDDENIMVNGDSATALRLAVIVFGEPSAVFLRDNGNYAARFLKDDVAIALEFDGFHRISGTLLPPKPI